MNSWTKLSLTNLLFPPKKLIILFLSWNNFSDILEKTRESQENLKRE